MTQTVLVFISMKGSCNCGLDKLCSKSFYDFPPLVGAIGKAKICRLTEPYDNQQYLFFVCAVNVRNLTYM